MDCCNQFEPSASRLLTVRSRRMRLIIVVATIVSGLIVCEHADAQLFRRIQARRQAQMRQQLQPRPTAPTPYAPTSSPPRGPVTNTNQRRLPRSSNDPSLASPLQKAGAGGETANYARPSDRRIGETERSQPNARGSRNANAVNAGQDQIIRKNSVRGTSADNAALDDTALGGGADAVKPKNAVKVDEKQYGRSILSFGDEDDETTSGQLEATPNDSSDPLPSGKSVKRVSMGVDIFTPQPGAVGVRVARIRKDSYADEAGIRVGDTIISIDNQPTRTLHEIASRILSRKVGERVKVRFVRGGTTYLTSVPLIERPIEESGEENTKASDHEPSPVNKKVAAKKASQLNPEEGPGAFRENQAKRIGGKTEQPEPRVRLGLMIEDPGGLRGVLVTSVREGTFASEAGIRPGDRIVSIDGRLIADSMALRREVAGLNLGDDLSMGMVRNGQLISKTVMIKNATSNADGSPVASAKDAEQESRESVGGIASGLGSVIGGLFGRGSSSKPSSNSNHPTSKTIEPVQFDDEMAFGDHEPIQPSVFGGEAATSLRQRTISPRSLDGPPKLLPGRRVESRKPSIAWPPLSASSEEEVMELPPGKTSRAIDEIIPPNKSQSNRSSQLPSKSKVDLLDGKPIPKDQAARIRQQIESLQLRLDEIEGR